MEEELWFKESDEEGRFMMPLPPSLYSVPLLPHP